MNKSIKPIEIHILGKSFRVACPLEQETALFAAADYLDGKMRDINEAGRVVGIERVAVLAALNITHELLSGRSITEDSSHFVSEKVEKLQKKIDSALLSMTQSSCID